MIKPPPKLTQIKENLEKQGYLKRLEELMEEMANAPREEMGKRQPGEIGAYEKSFKNKNMVDTFGV